MFYRCQGCETVILPFQYRFIKLKESEKLRYHPRCCLTDAQYGKFLKNPEEYVWKVTSVNKRSKMILSIIYWGFAGIVAVAGMIAIAITPILPKSQSEIRSIYNVCQHYSPHNNTVYGWDPRTDGTCHIEDCPVCQEK